jgi:hypothetical protein
MANKLQDLIGAVTFRLVCPVGWATAATVSEEPMFRAPFACTVTAVRLLAKGAITAHGTNFATIEARNKGTAGTGTTSVAALAFDTPTTDDVAAYDEKAIPLSGTAANLNLAEGEVLAIRKTVAASGLAVDGVVEVDIVGRAA